MLNIIKGTRRWTWMGLGILTLVLAMGACGKKGDDKGKDGKDGKVSKESAIFDDAKVKELGVLEIEGFKRVKDGGEPMLANVSPIFQNDKAQFMVTVGNAMGVYVTPLEKAKWEAIKDNLFPSMMLSEVHKKNPEMVFEINEETIAGVKTITVYVFSFVATENSKASTHSLTVFHNNGKKHIMINTYAWGSPPVDSAEKLKSEYSRDMMKANAEKILAAYLKHF